MKTYRVVFALTLILLIGLLVLAGCSSEPAGKTTTASTAPPKKEVPVLYAGQEAFNRMLAMAIRWSPDAQPVHMESDVADSTGQGGKAMVWRGFFVSPMKGQMKVFVCSGKPHEGVSANAGENALTPELLASRIDPFLLKVDSDKAYEVAQENGGEAYIKKDPKQPVTYVLEMDKKKHVPVWFVIYGTSLKDKKAIGVVNATTGALVRGGTASGK